MTVTHHEELQPPPQTAVRWALFGLLMSVLLIAIKLYGYVITQSVTVLSDALESCVHLVTSSFALFAVWLSSKPGDHNHPYGHGKIEYISAGLEGALVALAGVSVIVLGIVRLVSPVELPHLHIGAIVEFVAAVIAYFTGAALLRAGKHNKSPTLEADGIHIQSDALTSFAAFAGIGMVKITGWYWIDPIFALLLGVFLVVTGARVTWAAMGGVLDEWDPAVVQRIADVFVSVREPGWIAPHAVKVHRLGQAIHVDMHVVFPRFWDLERAHDASHVVISALQQEFGMRTEPMIHAEACTDSNCGLCDYPDCPIRKAPGTLPEWTPERIARRHRPKVVPEDA